MDLDATDHLVEMVRRRADVPRVRSSEVRRIIEALGELIAEGGVEFEPVTPT